ncbi:MAG TPA: TetR/AcrR family transcriptional regulator [Chloroflexota bacterium]|nr:TetR/AcrR family transcriptional regulator [Chloroflexota bacterium]
MSEVVTRSTRDKAATRERILQGAMHVFGERGYQGASMDEIARRAGSSKGGVYFHFPNKQTIFEALITELAVMLETSVREAIAREHGALARVDAALGTVIRLFSRQRGLTRLLLVEAHGLGYPLDREVHAARMMFASVIAGYLDQAVAEGAIAALDTAVAGSVWLGAINEVVVRWLLDEAPPSLEESLPALRGMLLRSIGVDPERASR